MHTEEPRAVPSTPGVASPVLRRVLSHSAGRTLPNAAQDTILVAFFGARACLWLVLIWCSPGHPGPFLQKIGWSLEYTGAWDFSFPGSGLFSSPC